MLFLYDFVYPFLLELVKPEDINSIGPILIITILAGIALWITMSIGYIAVTHTNDAHKWMQLISFVGITFAFLYPLARALTTGGWTLLIGLCFGLLMDYAFWYLWHFEHG